MSVDALRLRRMLWRTSASAPGSRQRGCLVEDQNPRLLQECSCNGKPLTLATGKLAAPGPDSLPETIGQCRNKR